MAFGARCQVVAARPACVDLRLYAGDTFSVLITIRYRGTLEPVELTGTWTAQVRRAPGAPDIVTSFAVDIVDAAAGQLRLSLTPEQTRLLAGREFWWDLQQVDGDVVRTWLAGDVAAVMDVTRV